MQGAVQQNRLTVALIGDDLVGKLHVGNDCLAERYWRPHHHGQKSECERQYSAFRTMKHCILPKFSCRALPGRRALSATTGAKAPLLPNSAARPRPCPSLLSSASSRVAD